LIHFIKRMGVSLMNYKFEDLLEREDGWVPRTDPLFDIRFKILQDSGEIAGEVKAHKLLLSLVSPVFRKVFFNSEKSRAETCKEEGLEKFEIKGSCLVSFKYFIRYLYSGRAEDLRELDLDQLFQLFLLADKFQVRGMKKSVRSYIKAANIDEYIDTFKVLIKYDDNYILENVCSDVYRKCVKSIRDKCTLDNLRFSDYMEEISRDDPDIQNIVLLRLRAELDAMDKKTATKNDIKSLKEEIEVNEGKRSTEIQKLKEKVTTATKNKTEIQNEVNSLKRKLEEIESKDAKKHCKMTELKVLIEDTKKDVKGIEDYVSSIGKRETQGHQKKSKCKNCKFDDCKDGQAIFELYKGLKVCCICAHKCPDASTKSITRPIHLNAGGTICANQHTINWNLFGNTFAVKYSHDTPYQDIIVYNCK